jgi:hypothetical protein
MFKVGILRTLTSAVKIVSSKISSTSSSESKRVGEGVIELANNRMRTGFITCVPVIAGPIGPVCYERDKDGYIKAI